MAYTKVKSKWSGGDLIFTDNSGTEIARFSGSAGKFVLAAGNLLSIRRRCTIAEVNAGVTLLAALTGYKYRMVACKAIAVGGAVGAVTTVDILATQATSSVKLAAFAQASLTQSAVLTAGGTGAAVLADGASFAQNDAASAITVGKTGATITTATAIDVIFDYTIEV